ncbi:VapC toxin family PIN domain ribonuclease [Natrinema sp. CBA1119]|uniref:type II toxin-antitoxin system VapC family toxin n=1 Tax=Natrinema sp. CBA1119 TaxID=1608465 RepID=UPI000BF2C995|nr:PIN domain-containing protein [Natrinema sp. CBA1119]PGF15238.1 VapC toxin family PIN domain ribonuclease [Natrinema sp. CBA1119]
MPRAVVDTSVLFTASYRRDGAYEDALPILRGMDDQSLPEAVILDFVLAETLNGLTTYAGHDPSVDFLDRIEENDRFHIVSPAADTLPITKSLFRRHRGLSFVDACIVAYMQANDIEYLYAFDDDFDRIDDITRLETATNPYDPR